MFNVDRSDEVPASLGNKSSYRGEDVYDALVGDFYGKCYLCERKDFTDVEIEHLDPHGGDANKKFDWNNLFLSCGRCNSIKGTTNSILNCTDSSADVCRAIRHVFPNTLNAQKITIEAKYDDQVVRNTADLIQNIFNSGSTAKKSLTKIYIKKELCVVKIKLIDNMLIYSNDEQTANKRADALSQLKTMMKRSYRFSAFIRWAVWEDETFKEILEPYMD